MDDSTSRQAQSPNTAPQYWYRLHGMYWHTDALLHADVVRAPADHVDSPGFDVVSYRTAVPGTVCPAGNEQLLEWIEGSGSDATAVRLFRRGDGSFMFVHRTTCFSISADCKEVVGFPGPLDDQQWLTVLVEGWVAALLIWLRGDAVLHASAVVVDGRLTAFVGRSGQGKSTIAAALCSAGATLFTDDVLRVGLNSTGQRGRASVGSSGLRLRANSRFPSQVPDGASLSAVHGRTVATLTRPLLTDLALDGIVIPIVLETVADTQPLVRLGEREALMALVQFPRLFHWVDPWCRGEDFKRVAEIASAVPVYQLTLAAGDVDAAWIGTQLAELAADAP
jgi:hypothetical protein